MGWGEGVNIALSIFGWGALRDWLSSLCDVSGGQLGCFQGCVSSSEMNKGWWKRILCNTVSVTFWYLSLSIGLVSSVTKWILGTEAPLGVLTYYDAWHVVSWKWLMVSGFHLWWVVLGLLSWQNDPGKKYTLLASFTLFECFIIVIHAHVIVKLNI